jgi:hypothetical protein
VSQDIGVWRMGEVYMLSDMLTGVVFGLDSLNLISRNCKFRMKVFVDEEEDESQGAKQFLSRRS